MYQHIFWYFFSHIFWYFFSYIFWYFFSHIDLMILCIGTLWAMLLYCKTRLSHHLLLIIETYCLCTFFTIVYSVRKVEIRWAIQGNHGLLAHRVIVLISAYRSHWFVFLYHTMYFIQLVHLSLPDRFLDFSTQIIDTTAFLFMLFIQ